MQNGFTHLQCAHADDRIKTCYLDSHFLGHSTHADLLREYNKALKDVCKNKLLQIPMVDLNVNLKLLEKVNEEQTSSSNFHWKLWTSYDP